LKKFIRNVLLKLPDCRAFDFAVALAFFWVAHKRVPIKNSGLFNDFLFYLKTSREIEDPLRQLVSDKSLVKIFYRGIFGEELAPSTSLVFSDFESFMQADLPDKSVLKPAHLSGCIFLPSGRASLDSAQINQVRRWFKTNMYDDIGRERNYRLLKPSVICEELIAEPDEIRDYKIFCYHGEPRVIQVDVGRHKMHERRLYTTDWQPLPFRYNKPLAALEPRPKALDQALDLATRIAGYFTFIRVDTFILEERVYLGELTSVPENAHGRFETKQAEHTFMDILKSRPVG
jgi:hypothetical protein